MATLGIHNIIETELDIKHFDNFSSAKFTFTTQGKYDKSPVYESVDLYFDNPSQVEAFINAINNATQRKVEA